jgi:hypothetical protein
VAAPHTGLPLRPLAWACAAFAGGVLLHLDRVPAWASLASFALILWRLAAARRRVWLPGALARALLALGMAAVVLARFHTLNGLTAGTTLLLLMAALKLLETRNARDELVLVGAGFFLLLAACLDRQQLVRTPLYALQAWVCCAAIGSIATPAGGGAVLVLPAAAGGVLGDSARRRRAYRPVGCHDTRQHHAAGGRLLDRLSRALCRPATRGRRALLARPGAARL